jgi:hypothetical protein
MLAKYWNFWKIFTQNSSNFSFRVTWNTHLIVFETFCFQILKFLKDYYQKQFQFLFPSDLVYTSRCVWNFLSPPKLLRLPELSKNLLLQRWLCNYLQSENFRNGHYFIELQIKWIVIKKATYIYKLCCNFRVEPLLLFFRII